MTQNGSFKRNFKWYLKRQLKEGTWQGNFENVTQICVQYEIQKFQPTFFSPHYAGVVPVGLWAVESTAG